MRYRSGLRAVNRRFPGIGDRFRLQVENPRSVMCWDARTDSPVLLIAFGGIAGKLGIPPFEFLSLTTDLGSQRLFVRDLEQSWYHRGLPGLGATIEEMGDSLEAEVRVRGIARVITAGVSAGGYAALLFGAMIGAERVLAFGPQTTVDLGQLAEIPDHRWDDRLTAIEASSGLHRHWVDLRKALPEARKADTSYELYFDRNFAPDRGHAERLVGLEGVTLRPMSGGEHKLAIQMREDGSLATALRVALEGGPT